MNRRIVQSPRAEQDVVEQALYIHRHNPAAAERFLRAIDRTFAALADMPGMGPPREYGGIKDLRMGRIRGFDKHLVFYRPIEGGIEVVRVLHTSRDLAGLFEEE